MSLSEAMESSDLLRGFVVEFLSKHAIGMDELNGSNLVTQGTPEQQDGYYMFETARGGKIVIELDVLDDLELLATVAR